MKTFRNGSRLKSTSRWMAAWCLGMALCVSIGCDSGGGSDSSEPVNVTGVWALVDYRSGDLDPSIPYYLTQNGSEISGYADSPFGDGRISGAVFGKEITWTVQYGSAGAVIFGGTVEGPNKIVGSVTLVDGSDIQKGTPNGATFKRIQ